MSVRNREDSRLGQAPVLAQGATVLSDGGVRFRVWAPQRRAVEVVLGDGGNGFRLTPEEDGYWSTVVESAKAGTRYRYRLDGDGATFPDPASRFLPEGPHGPSQVIDPRSFAWTDQAWTGLPPRGDVIYELHVGTFSPEGTWQGARQRLSALQDLGVTVLEVMPVAEFPGAFGWGYDGVGWFAPSHLYGSPDDFRAFVNHAHRLGIGVILDVVYNHFGPDGNFLSQFSPRYFSDQVNEWGTALNFDGDDSAPVRRLVTDNAAYWVHEFHLDGLRLDATQSISDRSADHVVAALTRAARAAACGRRLLMIAENEPQDAKLVRSPAAGGQGLDALWNDDFHHTAHVALTGRRHAYFSDYKGTASEWMAAAKYGFLFQGQRSGWQDKSRGQSTRGLPATAFVGFLENHDQVANSLWASRLWQQSNPGCHRAMTALLLLGPWTPLLFQGQEWSSSAPFAYFADHQPELARQVRAGRAEFMSQFPGCLPSSMGQKLLRDPAAVETFQSSRLRWEERALPPHEASLRLHRDLLALRRTDSALALHGPGHASVEVAALTPSCGVLRIFADQPVDGAAGQDRLLIVNLGPDIDISSAAEPLLAPPGEPRNSVWRALWCSEDPRYGGWGFEEPQAETGAWKIPGCAAVWLGPIPRMKVE